MSSSCDSDEFYDAEDVTPNRIARKSRSIKSNPVPSKCNAQSENESKEDSVISQEVGSEVQDNGLDASEEMAAQETDSNDTGKRVSNSHQGRRRFRELRQRMQTEEEDAAASPPDSQTSSVEGVFACPQTGWSSLSGTKVTHPFRIIEHDALSLQSLTSLGRVGRLLAGIPDPASVSRSEITTASSSSTLGGDLKEEEEEDDDDSPVTAHTSPLSSTASTTPSAATPLAAAPTVPVPVLGASASEPLANTSAAATALQEPDVIASTKGPVAPPRRKRKPKAQSATNLAPDKSVDFAQCCPLPSPASTIESLTRELEHSLDIQSATKGQYVVKPQDEDRAKADGPTSDDFERLKVSSPRGSLGSASASASARRTGSGSTAMSIAAAGQGSGKSGQTGSGTASSASASSNSIGRDLGSAGPGSGEAGRGTLSSRSSNSISRQKERRRSAGDEQGLMTQLNMFVRTRTDSGKQLTDMEILEQVTVLNLDTGERVPLSIAEDKLPQCINPLSLHIMRLTSEYVSTGDNSDGQSRRRESDEESVDSKRSVPLSVGDAVDEGDDTEGENTVLKRTTRLKRFLGSTVKKTMNKAKTIAQEVSHARHKEEVMDILDSAHPNDPPHMKLKASGSHKGPYEFDTLEQVQDLSGEHVGAVWCMKFSCCGRLLATAGQDRVLRVWVIRSAYAYFQEMRTKYNAEKVSPTPSQESLVSQHSAGTAPCDEASDPGTGPFMPRPFCKYSGHTSDLLDVSWSKNYFLLSSSMDKTVRLWHISRKECLCCFQHIDFVTAIVFHPRDDRYFLSGSLDGKLRLWNIPDKKVAVWSELDGQTKLITAANFFQNGKIACVGTYDGRCIFYNTDQLKYHTQINVRSTRGKNSTGRKISGIEPMPGAEKILVTSNDSRIRLYDLRDLSLSCKYKGYVNVSSQIKASFSHDGKYIVSGSENQCIYIWRTHHDYAKFSSVRRDRNDFWEGIKAHNAVVTCAVFAPHPDAVFKQMEEAEGKHKSDAKGGSTTKCPDGPKKGQAIEEIEDPLVAQRTQGCGGHVLVSADFNGCIKVFINKTKPKHSSLPASALV